jgi:hypothetical protein
VACLALLALAAGPGAAMEITPIGTMTADLAGEALSLPTVLVRSGDETESTAFLMVTGGFSSLSLTGLGAANARLDLSVTFLTPAPDAATPTVDVDIAYAPTGGPARWIAYAAPGTENLTLTKLTIEGDAGHATGSFRATLCFAADYAAEADPANCRAIEGRFDTPLTVER